MICVDFLSWTVAKGPLGIMQYFPTDCFSGIAYHKEDIFHVVCPVTMILTSALAILYIFRAILLSWRGNVNMYYPVCLGLIQD